MSTSSRCTDSRSTGTSGRSTSGRRRSTRSSAVTDLPVWVTEVGVSTFGAEEVQDFGLTRTAELLLGLAPHIHWYSLYDLPQSLAGDDPPPRGRRLFLLSAFLHGPDARRRHAQAARSPAFADSRPSWASASGFTSRIRDWRMRSRWMRRLGVRYLRTGLSWADSFRPERAGLVRPADGGAGGIRRDGDVLLHAGASRAACRITPARRKCPEEFAEFCATMMRALCRLGAAAPRRAQGRARRLRGIMDGRASCRRPRRFHRDPGRSVRR